jgi:DNA-binding transcriptional ArsR family regulator
MEITDATRRLSALANEHRLAAFRLLVKAGPEGLPAGEIASALGLAASSLSFHLSHLENAGMVSATRAGRNVIYRLETGAMRDLLGFLTEDCCQGRPELCAGRVVECGTKDGKAPARGSQRGVRR